MGRCVCGSALLSPALMIGTFIGFTAIVNKALTKKYDELVAQAPDLIKVLPWGKEFEVDVFRKPDFTGMGRGSCAYNN